MSVDTVIEALLQARRGGPAADAERLASAVTTADDAYLVQAAQASELDWFADGPPRHWKSGGASRSAVMTHAPLPPAGVWASPADARSWPFRLRYIEAEIALRLGQPVDAALAATLDFTRAARLVDAMTVSIEIVDSRWQQAFKAPALLRLADLQSHAALVLGEWVAYEARDWGAQPCRVQIGAGVTEYRGTHSCGDPAWVLPEWLRHATREGAVLPAGSVVSTGTWCGALEARAGDRVGVRFDGVGEAVVQL
ncbi:MAG TPA: fumarylacetoacetate hydrolase family protein [Rhizobacter sp.]|nr:fumarylacetoacetate hydrolase family protein [Rhizobacter sp.]